MTHCPRERGMALVSILWILALLGLIAATMAIAARMGTLDTHAGVQAAHARWLADAGIERGLYDLLALPDEATHDLTGQPVIYRIGEGTVTVRITDEMGKLDLNVAPAEVLTRLIDSQSLRDTDGLSLDARSLTDAIMDWRDRNPDPRAYGAEAPRYREEGLPQLPRNGPFPSISELANIRGLTPALAARLHPFVTTASRTRAVNPAHAPREVLYALPGALKAEVDQLITAREAGAPLPRLTGAALWTTTRAGPGFLIQATAHLTGGVRFRREVLVWIEGYGVDTPIPYVIERRPGTWLTTE